MTNRRQELDPTLKAETPALTDAPPEQRAQKRVDDPDMTARLAQLVRDVGGDPATFSGELVQDLLASALKLIPDGRNTGELKLITAAVKELRYAFRVFGQYPEPHKITIFGSARTPTDHPDFAATVEFSRLMAQKGWMVITGAGGGIMEAGHIGPGRDKSFGVAIRLPFEQSTNQVIAGDSKLIHFRYFFTRKLMFISQSEAVALFPGGFGTMDEGFELLTLVQTGKASMVPIVLCEGKDQTYWEEFDHFVRKGLLDRKLISPEDTSLYKICKTSEEAVQHILDFYRIYHSSRYVKDDLIIRLNKPISQKDVDRLSERFASLIRDGGKMTLRGPYDVEDDHLNLPRLCFTHNRRHYGTVRQLLDAINACDPA
ncbi:MAG: LOG family protein [Planctomycetaceae bacterium]|jgi:uncharacterized protein (TIGR00730 family)|nr:LOG family protein [Planctomycetaceae bacterium]